MRDLIFIALLLVLCAPPLLAADPLPTSWQLTVPAVDVPATQLVRVNPQPQPKQNKLWDWKLISMIAASHAVVEMDAWSTRRALARCPTCREANPILAPVIHSRVKTALVMHGLTALSDWGMAWAKKKNSKLWFLGGFIKIGVHGFATINNSRL